MPAKSIKLTYFNARGRAELARLVLAQAGAEFEDVRLEREEWLNIKPSKSQFLVTFTYLRTGTTQNRHK